MKWNDLDRTEVSVWPTEGIGSSLPITDAVIVV
jgi:hypothetical protein